MSDKEKIKQEIERLKHNTPNAYDLSRFMLLEEIEDFINSLPEESGCEVNCTTKSEDLEESAYEYANDANHYVEWSDGWETDNDFEYVNEAFKAGAEWQKKKMMKNTVLETKVMMDYDGDGIEIPYYQWLTLENTEILSLPDDIGLKDGDKVKIIIVKEE